MQEKEGEREWEGERESEVQHTVFVFNLSSCVKEENLYELFLQAGPVQKVIIPKDQDGNQKSYGFVRYKHAEAVPYAIALLDGIWLYGCPITLKHHYVNTHTVQNQHSWRYMASAFPLSAFPQLLCFKEGPYFPPLTPRVWPHAGFVSWSSRSDVLLQALDCTNSEDTGMEQMMESSGEGRRTNKRKSKQQKKHRR